MSLRSLHQLGMAPVLHRQFSSSSLRSHQSSIREDLTEDNKDVLIERLNDLVIRLSRDRTIEDTAVTAIHREVDAIEVVLRGERSHRKEVKVDAQLPELREDDTLWGSQTSSPTFRIRRLGTAKKPPRSPRSPRDSEMSPSKAAKIAKEAEKLATRMANTVVKLYKRKEESDRIHDLLVTRLETASERILFLEYRIAEMEDDFEANQSELKFLRIQVQAIEAQATPHIPPDIDPDLTESITNWKIDWEDINRRSKARRKKCQADMVRLDDNDSVWGVPPVP